MSEHGHACTRRNALRLLAGSVGLLAACQSPVSPVPPVPPAPSAPTSTAVPTVAPTVRTATPVPPTATAVPTAAPTATAAPTPTSSPTAVTPPVLASAIDAALQRGMQRGATPGGVVVIYHRGRELLRAAYGSSYAFEAGGVRAKQPIAATVETLYDLASLTKLFTATCVMRLVEHGRVRLDEPAARYVPDFGANNKGAITVRQLLTHVAGLPADIPIWESPGSAADRLRMALEVAPTDPPGRVYRYSDVGFIALGHLVEEVGGLSLEEAVRGWISAPLGLATLQFRPPVELKTRIAATEDAADPPRGLVWGEVHDPSAWSLGGIAGHAGLFCTARDVGLFGQAFLDGGGPLLGRDTVAEMT